MNKIRKSIFTLLSLIFSFTINANAEAYLWKATEIEGVVLYEGDFYGPFREELNNGKYTTFDWFANFAPGYQEYVYGEYYYGNSVWVEVYGMPQDEPTLKIGTRYGIIKDVGNILNGSNIIIGKIYRFFVPKKSVNSNPTFGQVDVNDTLRVYDGIQIKFEAGIR
ncbi:hypothetical protein CP965_00785 [Halarcobacter mediterraneus]|uniref:Uncharacterized protein n=1 Tax=Halarcobacter mediterraneus TaxID=2023153 RepID=A0A4V1M1I7_9BACT|nr:hypothetical protein [Halarcobacter mediterraneus]RXK14016.1 hypothetical protein CP965_00785 [Halarcobacter mediterraneus]